MKDEGDPDENIPVMQPNLNIPTCVFSKDDNRALKKKLTLDNAGTRRNTLRT